MEAYKFLRHRQLLPPDVSLHETAIPNYTWGDLIKLLDDYLNINSQPMPKIEDVTKFISEWGVLDKAPEGEFEQTEDKTLRRLIKAIESNFTE